MKSVYFALVLVFMLAISGCVKQDGKFIKAAYAGAPHYDNGSLDVSGLISLIKEHNANTYNYLVIKERDWKDLRLFLSEAEKNDIDVWITIAPPGKSSSEPFGTDYIRWAMEIAKLSKEYPSVKAWSIDNILLFLRPQDEGYIKTMLSAAEEINPDLEFIPVVYITDVQGKSFDAFKKYFDGIQLYYKIFPTKEGYGGYQYAENEIAYAKSKFSGKVILGIYATPWHETYPTTANYVRELIKTAKEKADGVMIYVLQREGEKLDAIREEFG